MVHVIPIALTYNTAYLLDADGERLLVDTGPDFLGAREILAAAVNGREPSMVVATHGHLDHAGLGAWWQRGGSRVAVGTADARLVAKPHFAIAGEFEAFVQYVKASGAPADRQADVVAGLERRRGWVSQAAAIERHPAPRPGDRWPTGLRFEPFEPDLLLGDDDPVPGGASALACPGHTPGNLAVIHEGEGLLFSGDQLLPDITPTPGVQFLQDDGGGWQRFPSLPPFVDSLRRIAERHFTRCYPGHGQPFDNVAEVIAANLAQVEQRTEKVLEELARGEATLHALSERLYPRALGRRWFQIIATVQGHLDLLQARAEARADGITWRTK